MTEREPYANPIAEKFATWLSVYLGPHTARVAIKTFSQDALRRGPETLTLDDAPALSAALRPMLQTFLGKTRCEVVLGQINRELGL